MVLQMWLSGLLSVYKNTDRAKSHKDFRCNKAPDEPAPEQPSAEERIAMMNEARELRLKPNKTQEESGRQREITAWLNALALPV